MKKIDSLNVKKQQKIITIYQYLQKTNDDNTIKKGNIYFYYIATFRC